MDVSRLETGLEQGGVAESFGDTGINVMLENVRELYDLEF
jgi:ribosomal silencing factor RsfS